MIQCVTAMIVGGTMRDSDNRSGELFSYVELKTRVGQSYPPRPILEIANAAPVELGGDGLPRVDLAFTFAAATCDLVRLPKLLAASP